MVLINLNAISLQLQLQKIILNVRVMDASGLWSFVYSINFQIREIPVRNHHFSCEKSLLLCLSRFLKKNPVWDLITTGKQIEKKLILPLKNTSELWWTWSLALPVHNFLSHLHFFKVGEMLLKYRNLMPPAEPILEF